MNAMEILIMALSRGSIGRRGNYQGRSFRFVKKELNALS